MFKRAMMIGVVALGLAAMQAGDAQAHLHGWQWVGYWRHVASYQCGGFFTQIKGLKTHPALFECTAVVREFQVLCQGPKKQDVRPGTPSGPITLMGVDQFDKKDQITEKVKGRAEKMVTFSDDGSPLLDDAFCAEENSRGGRGRHKWTAVDELVTSVDLFLKTYDCIADGADPCSEKEQAYEAGLHCVLPADPEGIGYSIDNIPPPNTDYDCSVEYELHLN